MDNKEKAKILIQKEKNLTLWNEVETTNPNTIKRANIGGQQRKTVNPQVKKENATAMFGPFGIGWGVKHSTEDYQRIYIDDGECILQYTAEMFYIWQGQEGRFPIAAAIKERAIYKRGKPDQYLNFDNEAIKKVRTDALTKGLSELGFNADIYKGWADDDAYAQYVVNKIGSEEQERAEQEAINAAEKWKSETLPDMLLEYADLTTVKAITTLNTQHIRKATQVGDKGAIKALADAKEKRIEEIKEQAQ